MESSILDLTKSINNLNNISYKTAEKLNKIGVNRVIDLLFYFPINIIKRNRCTNIADLIMGENCVITLKIIERVKRNKMLQVLAMDGAGEVVSINFFNTHASYLDSYLPLNQELIFLGTPEIYRDKVIINHPEKVLKKHQEDMVNSLDVVYRQHQDITSYKFKGFIKQALDILNSCEIPEWLDKEFLKIEALPSFKEALNILHNPKNMQDIDAAGKNIVRLAIDDMLAYHLALIFQRKDNKNKGFIEFKPDNSLNRKFLKELPFKLTEDQISVLKDLKQFFSNNQQNTVLLQGDVGSGKTVVCFISALFAIESGYQVAFMAPTEILATQHYNYFLPFAKKLGLNIALLKGKETKKNKLSIVESLEKGEIDILIGTHAIFQDSVVFSKLGLVIIDEQHRFGVNQRMQLSNKGGNPNVILTTATPIPRTLALAFYGDIRSLDIKHKPSNRKEIITKTIAQNKMDEVLIFMEKVIQNNEKSFWICPLVEESEKLEKISVMERFQSLQDRLPPESIYFIHGKMKTQEKNDILNSFKDTQKGAILVSTTVIEVGIDIPSCNIIVIENADSFGLAQLHQLRGRVGRSDVQGRCLLLYDYKISANARKKLMELKNSNDGFYLAEKDLEIRGYGDLIGVQQSGYDFFKVAKLDIHSKYLLPSLKYAKLLFEMQGNVGKSREINHKVKVLFNLFDKDFIINYTQI